MVMKMKRNEVVESNKNIEFKNDKSSVSVAKIHDNSSQELIHITEDKLKVILLENRSRLEKSKEWQVPLGILITIALTLATAKFEREILIFSASEVSSAAKLLLIVSTAWLIKSLLAIKSRMSIDELIRTIKNRND